MFHINIIIVLILYFARIAHVTDSLHVLILVYHLHVLHVSSQAQFIQLVLKVDNKIVKYKMVKRHVDYLCKGPVIVLTITSVHIFFKTEVHCYCQNNANYF
jgi:hypothetical protein